MNIPAIDFTLPDIHGGFTEIEGAVYLDEEFLVLDLEEAQFGGLRKKDRIIKIEPAALSSITMRRGLVRDRICIRPKKDALLQAVPGTHRGEVQLRVWRPRRLDTKKLIQEVRRRMQLADIAEDTEEEAP
ncbi:MAG: hypothetical protein JJ896_06395 [Rhodothermales bacterium]|nr:hypothetical protein [Rhodothermales bacterium]MBO6779264.1 hypothetical protein [Rhodothermales bacterium]